jgi:hypothetical protein
MEIYYEGLELFYADTELVVITVKVTYMDITFGRVNFTKKAKVLTDVRGGAYKPHTPYYIVICGLSVCTIFFHIMSKMARFSETKTEYKVRFLKFSLQLLSEILLILRRIERDMIK